jgi:hypothetical protein
MFQEEISRDRSIKLLITEVNKENNELKKFMNVYINQYKGTSIKKEWTLFGSSILVMFSPALFDGPEVSLRLGAHQCLQLSRG